MKSGSIGGRASHQRIFTNYLSIGFEGWDWKHFLLHEAISYRIEKNDDDRVDIIIHLYHNIQDIGRYPS